MVLLFHSLILLTCSRQTLGFTFRAGIAKPFSLPKFNIGGKLYPKDSPLKIQLPDRFFFGGPLMMRGWNNRELGPSAQGYSSIICFSRVFTITSGDSIGGDFLFASGLHLTSLIPFLSQYNVRGHLFANTGNVIQMNGKKNTPLFYPTKLSFKIQVYPIPYPELHLVLEYPLDLALFCQSCMVVSKSTTFCLLSRILKIVFEVSSGELASNFCKRNKINNLRAYGLRKSSFVARCVRSVNCPSMPRGWLLSINTPQRASSMLLLTRGHCSTSIARTRSSTKPENWYLNFPERPQTFLLLL